MERTQVFGSGLFGQLQKDVLIPAQPVLVLFLITAAAVGLGAVPTLSRSAALDVAIVAYFVSALAWGAYLWRETVARWVVSVGLVVFIFQLALALGRPEILFLLVAPTALSAGLLGVRGMGLLTLSELVALVMAANISAQGGSMIHLAAGAVFVIALVVIILHVPIFHLTYWSWQQYERTHDLLTDARQRQSELKEALDALAHSNRELALANEKMAHLRRVAQDAERAKASFVANVSHEFRTPLNMIIGLVDLVTETPDIYGEGLPEPLMQDLGIVHRNCEHLSSMINDVLDLSQIEAERLTLHRDDVSLAELIERATEVVEPLLDKKGLDLIIQVEESLPLVDCDPTRIRQVILNLVSNAARFTEEGYIAVEAKEEAGHAVVTVRDTGPGIAAEHVERIFEPFRQAPNQGGSSKGSGLGLSISKQFVELHEGRMWVTSELGRGSSFHFTLPLVAPHEPVALPQRWIAEGWVDRSAGTRLPVPELGDRVILYDANDDLYPVLSRHAGNVDLVPVRRIDEAPEAVKKWSAKTMIVNASEGDLWQDIYQARTLLDDTPVIGFAIPPRTRHARLAGAIGYLLKPLNRESLLNALALAPSTVKRILLVDDELDAQSFMERLLRTCDPEYEIIKAATGQETLKAMRDEQPDLVLLDIVLPDFSGWQVLAEAHKDPDIESIPVLIISAQDPHDEPLASPFVIGALRGGLSVSRMLDCALKISSLLQQRS